MFVTGAPTFNIRYKMWRHKIDDYFTSNNFQSYDQGNEFNIGHENMELNHKFVEHL